MRTEIDVDREEVLTNIDPDWRERFVVADDPFTGAPDVERAWDYYRPTDAEIAEAMK